MDQLVALCRWCHGQTDAPCMSGAARGDRLGRRPVYVRGRPAGSAWDLSSPDPDFCPRGQNGYP